MQSQPRNKGGGMPKGNAGKSPTDARNSPKAPPDKPKIPSGPPK